ncbi:metallophosphoesterase [Paracoccus sp. ME4]|uniref:metallophosphoesterase n=1 Tax=Paracoccus sp. ME4 TaxID=3138066 RepID=UPI00398AEB91
MKVLVLADLHLDEYHIAEAKLQLGREIRCAAQAARAVIIAGDLCEVSSERWDPALKWLRDLVPDRPIHVIPGNHDYYGQHMGEAERTMSRICQQNGCEFAQQSEFLIGGTRFLAATLWTDFGLFRATAGAEATGRAMRIAREKMPDYGYGSITTGNPERSLRPRDTATIHAMHLAWLKGRLGTCHEGPTVVVTHHAPSIAVCGPLSERSPCYASDLDALIDETRPEAWIFGHTHREAELRAPGGTLMRNVSVGSEAEITPEPMRRRVRAGILDLEHLGSAPADPSAPGDPSP